MRKCIFYRSDKNVNIKHSVCEKKSGLRGKPYLSILRTPLNIFRGKIELKVLVKPRKNPDNGTECQINKLLVDLVNLIIELNLDIGYTIHNTTRY